MDAHHAAKGTNGVCLSFWHTLSGVVLPPNHRETRFPHSETDPHEKNVIFWSTHRNWVHCKKKGTPPPHVAVEFHWRAHPAKLHSWFTIFKGIPTIKHSQVHEGTILPRPALRPFWPDRRARSRAAHWEGDTGETSQSPLAQRPRGKTDTQRVRSKRVGTGLHMHRKETTTNAKAGTRHVTGPALRRSLALLLLFFNL